MKIVIISGSARKNGNTSKICTLLRKELNADFIALNDYSFSGYDYTHANKSDDFLKIMRTTVTYDVIIFLTPVYWYAMSGLMKNFVDRITDCLKLEKETGRKLRGKYMAAVCCGSDSIETEGYFIPFRNSANYLGLHYLGDLHTWVEGDEVEPIVKDKINHFCTRLIHKFSTEKA